MSRLVSFTDRLQRSATGLPWRDDDSDDGSDERQNGWTRYLPLCILLALMVAPHPSLLLILVNHYLRTLHEPITFLVHLCVSYTLTFLSFTSLVICVIRDPGPVCPSKPAQEDSQISARDEIGLREALMGPPGDTDDDEINPLKWCRKCWAPKPERTHHCSLCGRCVLKMDHHCPWLGGKCVGHRTYPSFFHFITCITTFSAYVAYLAGTAFWWSFNNPTLVLDQVTPLHELFLFCAGVIFGLVVGSFMIYHIYLISTNQTTLESLSPFLLLRFLPPLPSSLHLSDPPMEHELSYTQRRLVREAHRTVKLYNLGWQENWAQVFGWNNHGGWVPRILYGGASPGDGRCFPRNPRAHDMLQKLAGALETADKEA
ncbi:zf-DHHC-domain-containing protein [Pisolithus croceorrhizus]|nr:zf-DHHC-domain-containing protein [Pisolithus croceorrhizus]